LAIYEAEFAMKMAVVLMNTEINEVEVWGDDPDETIKPHLKMVNCLVRLAEEAIQVAEEGLDAAEIGEFTLEKVKIRSATTEREAREAVKIHALEMTQGKTKSVTATSARDIALDAAEHGRRKALNIAKILIQSRDVTIRAREMLESLMEDVLETLVTYIMECMATKTCITVSSELKSDIMNEVMVAINATEVIQQNSLSYEEN
jgi:hypothetical protein